MNILVFRLIDEALAKGVKVAVCSTSNEKAVCIVGSTFTWLDDTLVCSPLDFFHIIMSSERPTTR